MNEKFRRWIGPAAALFALVGVYWLRQVLFPIVTGLFFAYLLSPVQHALVKRKVPSALASALCVLAMMLAAAVYAGLMFPPLVSEVMALVDRLPKMVDAIADPLARLGVPVPRSMKALFIQAKELLDGVMTDGGGAAAGQIGGHLTAASALVGNVLGRLLTVFGWIGKLLLVPFFAFYFLEDLDRVLANLGRLVPPKFRPGVFEVARRVDRMMAGFLRGQLSVSLVLAVVYSVGLSVMGVNFAVFLGILTGLVNFVPYAGLTLGGALSLLSVVVEGGSTSQLLMVAGLYILVNVVDGLVITPRLLGGSVGLSAPFVIAAVLIFGSVFGFIGVLLAVPLMSTARIVIAMLFETYELQIAADDEKSLENQASIELSK